MVDVIGRAKVIVETQIDRSSLSTAEGTIGAGLKKGAVVGVAALGTLAVGAVKTFKAFEEAEAQSRKLNQVLDNMGKSAAGPAVEDLAEKLSDLTAVDGDVIKQGETLLATFSNVAESAGDAGGVFERATAAAVDLAATGFGSVESASVMLGKALQDPEKGITALGRAGVTFSESQKQMIESLVATNDLADAQKIILEEVEKQVKGTAESTVTESDKITKEMGDLSDNLGALVASIVEDGQGVGTFSDALHKLNDELEDLDESEGWAGIRGSIRGIGHAIEFVVGLLGEWSAFWEEAGGDFRDFQAELDDGWAASKIAFHDFIDDVQNTLNSIPFLGRFIDAPDDRAGGSADGGRIGSGFRMVGENGPEIIELGSGGGYVHNNSETRRMLGTGDGSSNFTVNNYGPMSGADILDQWKWANRFASRFGAGTASVAG